MDWRSEALRGLKESDALLSALSSALSGEPTEEQLMDLWRAYVETEKSVVYLKVELDEENPGVFVNAKVYRVPDERQAVSFALSRLRSGARRLESGDLREALRELREARNYLRVLVKQKRRTRIGRAQRGRF